MCNYCGYQGRTEIYCIGMKLYDVCDDCAANLDLDEKDEDEENERP